MFTIKMTVLEFLTEGRSKINKKNPIYYSHFYIKQLAVTLVLKQRLRANFQT